MTNTNFQCPFCLSTESNHGAFLSWLAVSIHAVTCKNKTFSNPYIFDSNVGIINVKDFQNGFSARYIKYLYPGLAKSTSQIRKIFKERGYVVDTSNSNTWNKSEMISILIDCSIKLGKAPKTRDLVKVQGAPQYLAYVKHFGSWENALKEANIVPYPDILWPPELIIEKILEFNKLNNRIPQAVDFSANIYYPNYSTVQEKFGSWNKAIEAAGLQPDENNGWGVRTRGLDNVLYRSKAEAYFVDNYLYGKYEYQYEIKYVTKLWKYDFYIPSLDLYIELDGGIRPDRVKQKIEFNKLNNINCLVIKTSDLYKKGFTFL